MLRAGARGRGCRKAAFFLSQLMGQPFLLGQARELSPILLVPSSFSPAGRHKDEKQKECLPVMGVFYFPRRTRRFLLLLFSGLTLVAAGTLKHRKEIPAGSGYRRVEGYPPLVYLPGYTGGPAIRAGAAILVEEVSGMILYAKNEHQRRAPASTTKIPWPLSPWKKGTWKMWSPSAGGPPGPGVRACG